MEDDEDMIDPGPAEKMNVHHTVSLNGSITRLFRLKIRPIVDLTEQTVEQEDHSRVLRPSKSAPSTKSGPAAECLTVYDAFQIGKSVAGANSPCLGRREMARNGQMVYKWMTYKDVEERSLNLGAGLRKIGIGRGQGEMVGILMKSRPEWMIIDQACCAYSNISVPIYDTMSNEGIQSILGETGTRILFCKDVLMAKKILCSKRFLPMLEILVLIDSFPKEFPERCAHLRIKVYSMAEVEMMGKGEGRENMCPPEPPSVYSICYTAGTSGAPKGVVLTHENFLSSASMTALMPHSFHALKDTQITFFSFLSFANALDRLMEIIVLQHGGRIGYYAGDMKRFADDLRQLRPSLLLAVPRILNTIYTAVWSELSTTPIKRMFFRAAMGYKTQKLRRGIVTNSTWADRFVFRKVQEALGGGLVLMIVGSAPCHESILQFARCVFGCMVLETYGMTETAFGGTVTMEGDCLQGHSGAPEVVCAVKLVDTPKFGKWNGKKQGEICIRGPVVTPKYFDSFNSTNCTIDDDGWLHTGDIGEWTREGSLRILCPVKTPVPIGTDGWISPEKLEGVYTRTSLLDQCFVYGRRGKGLVAIGVPSRENFLRWCSRTLKQSGSVEELCLDERVCEAVRVEMVREGKRARLKQGEQISSIFLCPEEFSVHNNLLTPTMRNRRHELEKRFQSELDEMFKKLEGC